jgi:sulfatase maturation enzyme AslB (radical SAM superfamily)
VASRRDSLNKEVPVHMNTVNMRFDLRVPEDIYDFLVEESRLKKLSFEGLLLFYIKERMQREERERV